MKIILVAVFLISSIPGKDYSGKVVTISSLTWFITYFLLLKYICIQLLNNVMIIKT